MTYEFHGIELLDMTLEMQPLTQSAKLFGYILGIARLRSVQDQDASLGARHCSGDGSQLLHGRRCLLSIRMAWNLHGFQGFLLFFCFVSWTLSSRTNTPLVSEVYTCMGDISRPGCKRQMLVSAFMAPSKISFGLPMPGCRLVGPVRSDNRRQR